VLLTPVAEGALPDFFTLLVGLTVALEGLVAVAVVAPGEGHTAFAKVPLPEKEIIVS
jgi:hypothetical protein